jgi:hypothetical protein
LIKEHVLRHRATRLEAIDADMAAALTPETIEAIVALIPDGWLVDETPGDAARYREAYRRYLHKRLESPRRFVEEAVRVR